MLDENQWTDVYLEVIESFLSSIHDVTRYTISVKKTTKGLGDKIDLVNLLTL